MMNQTTQRLPSACSSRGRALDVPPQGATEALEQKVDTESDKQYLNERLQELQDQFDEIAKKDTRKRKGKPARKERGRGVAILDGGAEEGNIETSMTQEGVQLIQSNNKNNRALATANERTTEHGNGSRQARWAVLSTAQNSDGQGCGLGYANNSQSQSKNRTKTSNKPIQSLYLQTLETQGVKSIGHKSSKINFTTMHHSLKNSFVKN